MTTKSVSFSEKNDFHDIPNRLDILIYKHNIWYTICEIRTAHAVIKRETGYIKFANMEWPINKCLKQALLGNFTTLCIIQPLVMEIMNSIFEKIDLEI